VQVKHASLLIRMPPGSIPGTDWLAFVLCHVQVNGFAAFGFIELAGKKVIFESQVREQVPGDSLGRPVTVGRAVGDAGRRTVACESDRAMGIVPGRIPVGRCSFMFMNLSGTPGWHTVRSFALQGRRSAAG
jgi:hypothetical protein